MEKTIIYKTNLESADATLKPLFYAKMWVQNIQYNTYSYSGISFHMKSDWDINTDEYITTVKTVDGTNKLYLSTNITETALSDDIFTAEVNPQPGFEGVLYIKCVDNPVELEFYGINHINAIRFNADSILSSYNIIQLWCDPMDFCTIPTFDMALNYNGYAPNNLKYFNVANFINWNPDIHNFYVNENDKIYGTIDAPYNTQPMQMNISGVTMSLHFFNRTWGNIVFQDKYLYLADDITPDNLDKFKLDGRINIITNNIYSQSISLIILKTLALEPSNRIICANSSSCFLSIYLADVDSYATEIETVRARIVDELGGTLTINGTTY